MLKRFLKKKNITQKELSEKAAKSPSPLQVEVVNNTDKTLTAVLFGRNRYLLSKNFGSDVGLTIEPTQYNVSYLELLNKSADEPFETSIMRIQSSNVAQVTQIFSVSVTDENGQEALLPIIATTYSSPYQMQSEILDIPYKFEINGNKYITVPILANTTATYTFFPPSEKVNTEKESWLKRFWNTFKTIFIIIFYTNSYLLFSSSVVFGLSINF